MKKLFYSLFVCTAILTVVPASGQQRVCGGIVVDKAGEPVIGAAVIQAGNGSNGAVTGIDGTFSITVPSGAELSVRCMGYSSITVKATEKMTIVLQDDENFLEEVVVVGYGVQKKSNLTGAISSISSEDIQNRSIVNLESALQGKTPGVNLISTSAQPGAVPTVRIRGISSNGTSDPLFVVDGLIVSDINGIDPNSIESMEVLKDAASAAIYGAQAGNGVLLITTKKGKKGNGFLSYDFQLAMNSLAIKPKLLSAEEQLNQNKEEDPTFTDSSILRLIDSGVWDGTSSTDWYPEAFESSPTYRHTVSMQGANDKGSFFLSLGNVNEDGIIKGHYDTFKRFTVSANADYQVKPWLKVGITADFANYNNTPVTDATPSHGSGPYNNFFASVMSAPAYAKPFYAPDELPTSMKNALADGYVLFTRENGDYYCAGEGSHPLVHAMSRDRKNFGNKLSGTLFANFTPIEGLVYTSRLGYNITDSNSYTYNKFFFANQSKFNSELNEVTRTNVTTTYYQWENFVNFDKTWGKHDFGVMAGISYSQNDMTYLLGNISKAIKDDPLFADLRYVAGDAIRDADGFNQINRKLSYFGRLNYSFAGKYLAEAVFRADAADTSVLPSTNRWGYFPSFSAGWIMSNEDFFKALGTPVSFLKLRASWGLNGSTSNLKNYSYSNSLATNPIAYSFTPGATGFEYTIGTMPTQLYNPSLKWETSEQIDLGLDLRMFRDRLTMGFDWFNKTTRDLIVANTNVPYEAGNKAAPVNAGNVLNRGVELEISWKDAIGDFFYSVSGNIATLHNEVTYLDPNVGEGRINGMKFASSGFATAFEKGFPIWYFRGYHVEGLDENGAPIFQDVKEDGIIDDADKIMTGKPLPDFTYGITLNLGYKDFDLTVFGSGSQGNDVLMAYSQSKISYRLKSMYDQRWTPQNPNAKYAKPAVENCEKYNLSDAMIFDGSFFRIKQIQLGYTLPKNICGKIALEKLRVYASLDNFFLFTSYPGMDPEASSDIINGIGLDYGCYPTTRKVVFGASITF
ncbi:MAG: TonB-dependent receptor [Bacteroidales bacterium]|nr:TonB-dependent receptor [Bacteroidales bacterium]